ALDRIFACLVAGGAGAFLNALKHHVVRKHGTGGLRGVFQGRLFISQWYIATPTTPQNIKHRKTIPNHTEKPIGILGCRGRSP
ncbi:hypothetical protein, partial [Xanthomonas euvesicatoria]